MDPTPEQAEVMMTIADVAEWVGFIDPVRDSLLNVLGAQPEMHPRVIAGIPDGEFVIVVGTWVLNGQTPTPVQKSMATLLARACRIACKLSPCEPAKVQPPAPVPSGHSSTDQNSSGRKIELNEIIDPKLDTEAAVFNPQQVQDAFNVYRARLGAFPMPHEEITTDQLSALAKVFGSGAAPYVDLGLFGAYGHRILKRTKLQGARLSADGQL
eukprot:2171888-Amphidinium_carterae.1